MTDLPEWALPIRDEMAREMCGRGLDWMNCSSTCMAAGKCADPEVVLLYKEDATAALAVALPLIAEHMAGVADDHYLSTPDDDHQLGQADCASNIAAAIRQEATPRKP